MSSDDPALEEEYENLNFSSQNHPAVALLFGDGDVEALDVESLHTQPNSDGEVPDRRIVYSHDSGVNDERELYREYTLRIVNGETEKGGRNWTKNIRDSERSWGGDDE